MTAAEALSTFELLGFDEKSDLSVRVMWSRFSHKGHPAPRFPIRKANKTLPCDAARRTGSGRCHNLKKVQIHHCEADPGPSPTEENFAALIYDSTAVALNLEPAMPASREKTGERVETSISDRIATADSQSVGVIPGNVRASKHIRSREYA